MQYSRRTLLKGALILIGASAVPYFGLQVVKNPEVLDSNPINSLFPKRIGNAVILSHEDIQMISSFLNGNNIKKIHDLIQNDYALGRTIFFDSFLYSITELKITKYRRDHLFDVAGN